MPWISRLWNTKKGSKPNLDRSEYVFGDSGGKGTPAASFFKTIAGNRNRPKTEMAAPSKVVGASYSHTDLRKQFQPHSFTKPIHATRSTGDLLQETRTPVHKDETQRPTQDMENENNPRDSYADLDDDWDADVKSMASPAIQQNGVMAMNMNSDLNQQRKDLYPKDHLQHRKGLRSHIDGIVVDPVTSLYTIYGPSTSTKYKTPAEIEEQNARIAKFERFKKILQCPNIDLKDLKAISWGGIPDQLRSMAWQLLLGYLPSNVNRRVPTLARKRKEYLDGIRQAFESGVDKSTWHQISIDVPRTNPHIKLYSFEATQRSLERILYLWAVRHPASGYVQGINDLATPFLQTFLSAYIYEDVENFDPGTLPGAVMDVIEADTFWCLSKVLDGIQDNYIHAQPGIIRQVQELHDLTQRIDSKLVKHLDKEKLQFIQFSFRWMNCLLMRELSVRNTIRMWDTYMAEGSNGFSEFHIYVCAAFLVKWSDDLQQMDFQEIMMFLQSPPSKKWKERDIELLLSEAYMWQSLYKNATAHLR